MIGVLDRMVSEFKTEEEALDNVMPEILLRARSLLLTSVFADANRVQGSEPGQELHTT
jgi:hypothetical protein